MTIQQRARRRHDADDRRCRCAAQPAEVRLRVLLADDHGIVRRGLRSLLESEPGLTVVAEAADGLEALRLCEEHQPDMLILDIAMPKLNGIEVAARSQKLERAAARDHPEHARRRVVHHPRAGRRRARVPAEGRDRRGSASGRARRGSGQAVLQSGVTAVLVEDYVRQLRARGLTDSYHLLTDREKEVLQLLAEGRSNKEVATLLDLGLSTVETHRANLMQKLNLHNTAEIVLYAVRKGIIV